MRTPQVKWKGSLLYKVVPKHARWVFENSDEDGDLGAIILDERSGVPVLWVVDLLKVNKSCETPVTLFRDESVMCI